MQSCGQSFAFHRTCDLEFHMNFVRLFYERLRIKVQSHAYVKIPVHSNTPERTIKCFMCSQRNSAHCICTCMMVQLSECMCSESFCQFEAHQGALMFSVK